MVVARVERADVHGRRDERPGTGTDGDGSTAPANTRVSLAARDSGRRSLRPGVGQGDRGSRRYRVRLGFANVRIWPKADISRLNPNVRFRSAVNHAKQKVGMDPVLGIWLGSRSCYRRSVARMKCIVQIDASENGEHIGLQKSHQKLQRI